MCFVFCVVIDLCFNAFSYLCSLCCCVLLLLCSMRLSVLHGMYSYISLVYASFVCFVVLCCNCLLCCAAMFDQCVVLFLCAVLLYMYTCVLCWAIVFVRVVLFGMACVVVVVLFLNVFHVSVLICIDRCFMLVIASLLY